MIEKAHQKNMGAETEVPEAKTPTAAASYQDHHAYAVAAKSLLEEEEDDFEEEEVLSRNPSLMRDEEEDRDHPSNRTMEWDENNFENTGDQAMNCTQAALPMCQGDSGFLTGCQGQSLAEQIEFMTQCHHPLDLLSIFHEESEREGVELLPGMYTIPKSCEYCGVEDSDHCTPNCQRPKSFFRKKRPPFCPPMPSQWDRRTDFSVKKVSPAPEAEEKPLGRRPSFLPFRHLFGDGRKSSV